MGFGVKWTRERLSLLAKVLIAIGLASVIAIWFWWPASKFFFERNEPVLKLLGYVIGPLLALTGFFATRLDKIELSERSEEIGRLGLKAEQAMDLASQRDGQLIEREQRIGELEADLARITTNSNELWKVRDARPFPGYYDWHRSKSGARIVTTAIFKGGVGKTHLTANFAAYISETKKKRVLLIDLDYQGSLSNQVLEAAGREEVESHVDRLLKEEAGPIDVLKLCIPLQPELERGWIIPSNYTLNEAENLLLLQWMVRKDHAIDVRYRLARLLLNPEISNAFDVILLDTPPRMTIGALNALVASHFYLVPTILDRVSSEAVRPFVTNIEQMSKDLRLDLQLAGVVPSMTRGDQLTANEMRFHANIREEVQKVIGLDREPLLRRNIPRRAVVTNGASPRLPYFLQAGTVPLKTVYDELFDEVWDRIMQ